MKKIIITVVGRDLVGIIAKTTAYMAKNNLSLEEYLEALKQYTSKDRLTVTADGKTYEIYMASGTGTLSVPKNYAYDVSGTNCGSVVVTIDRSAAVVKPKTETTGTTAATTAAEPGTGAN